MTYSVHRGLQHVVSFVISYGVRVAGSWLFSINAFDSVSYASMPLPSPRLPHSSFTPWKEAPVCGAGDKGVPGR